MALWSTLGDLMLGSGWPESLKDAGIVNSLGAGMCLLKAVNVMRTMYAHQVTAAVLDILRKKSLHQQWSIIILRRMNFSFVGAIPNLQVLVTSSEVSERYILFIRANRERKMNLMISALIELVDLSFAFDHNNHAKRIQLFF